MGSALYYCRTYQYINHTVKVCLSLPTPRTPSPRTLLSCAIKSYEPHRRKTYLLQCVPGEDSDQPAYSHSLIRIFTSNIFIDSEGRKVSSCGQADQSHRWMKMSKGTFSHVAGNMLWVLIRIVSTSRDDSNEYPQHMILTESTSFIKYSPHEILRSRDPLEIQTNQNKAGSVLLGLFTRNNVHFNILSGPQKL